MSRPLMRLRLISWNLHGPPFAPRRRQRMRAAATEVARRAPDVIVLQEVWFPSDAAHLVEQFGRDYDSIDVPSGCLFGRKGGLLAFLRTSSLWARVTDERIARFEPFSVAASPFIFWQGDGLGSKGIQVIELRHRESSQQLFVLNTHLQAQYGKARYEAIRRAQIDQLATVAAGLTFSVPVLAAGDINTRPEETALYAQLNGAWEDLTVDLRRHCGCGTAVHEAGAPEEWIDYVLAHRRPGWKFSAQIDLIRNTAVDEPFSDHNGVDAVIDVSKAAPR